MGTSFNIKDKVAVVTGGAGILCAAMCRVLAEAGAKVAVLDLRSEPAEALAAELGNGAIGVACNVLDKNSVETAARQVMDTFGCVDILIMAPAATNLKPRPMPNNLSLIYPPMQCAGCLS